MLQKRETARSREISRCRRLVVWGSDLLKFVYIYVSVGVFL